MFGIQLNPWGGGWEMGVRAELFMCRYPWHAHHETKGLGAAKSMFLDPIYILMTDF